MILSIFEIIYKLNLMDNKINIKPNVGIFISKGDGYPHGPRIKVYYTGNFNSNENFSILISDNPDVCKEDSDNYKSYEKAKKIIDGKTLNKIKDWVYFHRKILLMYWRDSLNNTKFIDYILKNYKWKSYMSNIRNKGYKYPLDYQNILDKIKNNPEEYERKFDKDNIIKINNFFN